MYTKGSHGKAFKKRMASLMIAAFWGYQLLVCGPALAAPQGGVVTSGSAAINQAGNVTNINQIDEQGFDQLAELQHGTCRNGELQPA